MSERGGRLAPRHSLPYRRLVPDVPLVRVEGKAFARGATLTIDRMLREPVLLRASKSDGTRRAESAFNLGDSLYFYVGHACPDFGQIVLVFDPTWSESAPGSTTPFDTGGLLAGLVRADGTDDVPARCRYLDQHRRPLLGWRTRFAAYLSMHFASAVDYVLGRRGITDDPSGRLLDPSNERRAWTWELQVHQDHRVTDDLLLLCIPSDVADALRAALLQLPPDEAEPWETLLDSARSRVAPADGEAPVVCSMAEAEIASWL